MRAATVDTLDIDSLQVIIDNEIDSECTVITVEGKDQPHLLMSLSGAFTTAGFKVVSASITSDDGRVLDVFRIQSAQGKKVSRARSGISLQCRQCTARVARACTLLAPSMDAHGKVGVQDGSLRLLCAVVCLCLADPQG